jgi:hypothetical protein
MHRATTMALTRREAGQRYAAAAALVLSDLILCAGCNNATAVEIQDSEEITEPYGSMADLVVFRGFSGSGFPALEQSGYTLLESREGSGTASGDQIDHAGNRCLCGDGGPLRGGIFVTAGEWS